MLKQIIALMLIAAAPMAQATERFVLSTYKHWQVSVMEYDDGDLGCSMKTHPERDFGFFISFDEHGLDGNLYDVEAEWGEARDVQINLWIDDRSNWAIYGTVQYSYFYWDIAGTHDPNQAVTFLQELRDGKALYFDTNRDRQWDYRFSLRGSAVALKEMAQCMNRISQGIG